ncbi:hypothetical protein HID58_032176 [Brassica napus]|uniref:Uncharacterized protein n=3 Tax=Brassica TaxID=3705 RepID=A0ABQ8BVN3_BRANA|nr:hypothetical protein HID58_032176 [Brassica napus]
MDIVFLLIGDIHPFLLANLLRIFIHLAQPKSEEDEEDEEHVSINMSEDHQLAWMEQSAELLQRIEQVERRVKIMGDDIVAHLRLVQRSLVTQLQADTMYINEEAKMKKELKIFKDAKLLRSSVLMSIIEATNDHQRVLFLQRLCHMLEHSKTRQPFLLFYSVSMMYMLLCALL